MRLIYQGKRGEYINGVPARDLEAHEVQAIAQAWGYSLAQTEGLLIKRGLYRMEASAVATTTENIDKEAPKQRVKKVSKA